MTTTFKFKPRYYPILLLIFFSLTNLYNTVAQGFTYQWGHPTPQGNIVYNMAFQDTLSGWAVTGCGQILMTSDGGLSWTITLASDSACVNLYDIILTPSHTLIASGDLGRIMRSTDQGTSWQTQSFPNSGRLYDLAAIPGGGISAAGQNGQVLISFDEGITWINKGPGGEGYARNHYWKTQHECYVVGFELFAHTTDGGNTWTQVEEPSFFGLNEIYFTYSTTGYAIEESGGTWKTTNGGESWFHVPFDLPFDYRVRTLVIDPLHWFSVTYGEGGDLWETTDGGINWNMKATYMNTGFPCIVKNGNRILFGSDLGDIYYTTDGGNTIHNATTNLAISPRSEISVIGKRPDGTLFANSLPATVAETESFFRSDDDGLSWYLPENPPGLRWITDIQFSDDLHGVLGTSSDIRYTSDGGDSWQVSNLPEGYDIHNFATPATNTFFVATYSPGTIFRSLDHGASWQVVENLPVNTQNISTVEFANENTGFVSFNINTTPKFYKTTDGGNTWTFINSTGIPGLVLDMHWFDENLGLASNNINGESSIFRTTNGGLTWSKVLDSSGRLFSGNKENRVAVFDKVNGFFQESTDGGLTWTSYYPPLSSSLLGYSGYVTALQIVENGYIIGGAGNRLIKADIATPTGTNTENPLADSWNNGHLLNVYPNPVNASFTIALNLPKASQVYIELLDIKGSRLAVCHNAYHPSGQLILPYNDFRKFNIKEPGTYFLIVRTNSFFETTKVIFAF